MVVIPSTTTTMTSFSPSYNNRSKLLVPSITGDNIGSTVSPNLNMSIVILTSGSHTPASQPLQPVAVEEEQQASVERRAPIHSRFGNKWATIASFHNGRSNDVIKNHWNSMLKQKHTTTAIDGVKERGDRRCQRARRSTVSRSAAIGQAIVSKICKQGNVIWGVGDVVYGIYGICWAFEDAWNATCKSSVGSPATMQVPSGSTFLIQPIVFAGPCNSDVDVLNCGTKATGFTISNSDNVYISDLTFMDSPQKHIGLESSTWVRATNLTITAPENSPNTDGIHVQQSQNVFIDQTLIGTGDDCISIGDGSAYLNISGITCGPGHGISVGSLGFNGANNTVEHVFVSDVVFRGTSNGARIKTWQTSAVEVSNVRYIDIHGASSGETAIKFACSETVPCTDISMDNIDLTSDGTSNTTSSCQNVQGTQHEVFPSVPCLTSN
ncbi:hypothetical protein RHMOL_Rhmol10G0042600 [Rhododendron molle]|uniref:Uncharacterized protein n=1 Tax=Rhododendron molle TaxID=49168 RepID=A0ACC0LYY9_RHOML|nr:hypothetical protein RHMOL_Rhmol10G0042600 [Rhododendron molle]